MTQRFFIKLIFLFFITNSSIAGNIPTFDGELDKTLPFITEKYSNFDGHLVFFETINGVTNQYRIEIKNNILFYEMGFNQDGTTTHFVTENGGARMQIQIGNSELSLLKVEMKEGKYSKWKDVTYAKTGGMEIGQLFMRIFDKYYGLKYRLDELTNLDIRSVLGWANISDQEQIDAWNKPFTITYIGTTCYKDRNTHVLVNTFDSQKIGYSLRDAENGLVVGGELKINILGETINQSANNTYFENANKNCSMVEKSNKTKNIDLEEKLLSLKNLLEKGLITQDQYDEKSSELLSDF